MPKFIDSTDGLYNGYTSDVQMPNTSGNNQRGIVQVSITTGTVDLQARITSDAPWVTLKTYSADALEEVVLAPYWRVIASDEAVAWLESTF